jgi:hypothetical protein
VASILYTPFNRDMSSATTQIPTWSFEADYVETCNCDYGCPCNFNGFPTYGSCQTLILFHIRSGSYGDTKLDGPSFYYCSIVAKGHS